MRRSLTPRERAEPPLWRTPRVTVAIACLYGALGVIMPYLARWLEVERGLQGAEMGAVLSAAQLTRIVIGPLIAHWADSRADRRTPIRIVCAAALGAYAAFFFLAHDFWSLLALGFVALTLSQTVTPLVEAALLRAASQGRMSFGLARDIGSLAFILASIAGGALVAHFGLGAVAAWVLSGLACLTLSSWFVLPSDPAPGEGRNAQGPVKNVMALLNVRRFLIVIIACGLIQCAHAFYYGFSTLTWRGQGISAETVGWLWGCGVAFEVAFLWSLRFIERRVSPEALILIGGIGGAVRWTLLGLAPTGWALWPLQAMHALSFCAAYVGAMRLIYRETPEASAGLAQTLYASLSGGLLMGVSTLASGLLYDAVGARGYWVMAGLSAIGASLALLLLSPAPRPSKVPQ